MDEREEDLRWGSRAGRALMVQYAGDVPLWDEPVVEVAMVTDHPGASLDTLGERHAVRL